MDTYQDYFKDKKVTVVRIGLLGRGVGDTAFMAEMGADVLVVDDAPKEAMQPSVDALKEYENVRFKFGPYDAQDFVQADMVLVGAGMPFDHEVLVAAQKAGVPLKQSAALFAELSGVPVIGVTGTRGKTTVTELIHHTLSVVTGEPVILGGNIRGVSNLQLLKEVREGSLAVMELDSWQLQGWGWSRMSPQIAVFTNFMEDHLNYYMSDGKTKEQAMELYFRDKANIFLYQEESGVLITTPEVFEQAKKMPGSIGQEVVLADSSVLPEDCLLAMPGEHNRLNAALAYEALKATSLTNDVIFEGFASFPGVEGRLQYMREVNHVRYYNDNNATTPQATIAALEALDLGNKNIVLIAGGAYKEVDPAPMGKAIKKHCKQTILIPGTGTDTLLEIMPEALVVENLAQAVEEARLAAENGDVVVLSPGFASFGAYKNEYERNDEFVQLIGEIQ